MLAWSEILASGVEGSRGSGGAGVVVEGWGRGGGGGAEGGSEKSALFSLQKLLFVDTVS